MWRHLEQGFAQCEIAVVEQVIIQAFRIHQSNASEHDALLHGQGARAGAQPGNLADGFVHPPDEAFDDMSLNQMLLDQHPHIVRADGAVDHTLRVDHHQRQVVPFCEVADRADLDLVKQTVTADLRLQSAEDFL